MPVRALVEKYRELYGEPTRTRNRDYLQKRLAWRIQELAEGGLPASALARIRQLGDDLPEPWRRRLAPKFNEPQDPRMPVIGTVLRRIHDGVEHRVTVCADGFDYQGRIFTSLSAVAKHITKVPWNGFLFFGLKKRLDSSQEAPRHGRRTSKELG
jgi:hypothetical protein